MNGNSPLLEMQNITVMRGERRVLHGITIRIGAGEHVAILGPNGCGKSTLIKTITRECYPLLELGSCLKLMGRETWNIFQFRAALGIVSNDLVTEHSRDISGAEAILSGFFSSVGIWPNHEVTPAMRERAREILQLLEIAHLADVKVNHMLSGSSSTPLRWKLFIPGWLQV